MDTKVVGLAGEHHVCARLAEYEWAPSLTRDGLARTDVLAVHVQTRDLIEVQVKTISYLRRPTWPLGERGCLPEISAHEWYVFVMLGANPGDRPDAWVVPRNHVAAATWIEHETWRTNPYVADGSRNARLKAARVSEQAWSAYRERWDLLRRPTTEAPVMLPSWMQDAIRSGVGLPDGHPWLRKIPKWPRATPASPVARDESGYPLPDRPRPR